MKLRPRSLHLQVILLVSAVLLLTGVGSAWITTHRQSAQLVAAMRENSAILARNLAKFSTRFLVLQDYADLEAFLLEAVELPDLRRLLVCEPDGKILAEVRREAGGKPQVHFGLNRIRPPASAVTSVAVEQEQLVIWQPITAGDLLGWLRAEFNMRTILQTRQNTLQNNLLLAILWVLLSATLILFLLRPTARTFQVLARFARDLADSKGAQLNLPRGTTEFLALETALNYASNKLHTTETQLIDEQHQLRESEELYRSLISASPDGVGVIDQAGKVVFASAKILELLQLAPESALRGTDARHWVIPEEQERITADLAAIMTGGTIPDAQYQFSRAEGSRLQVEISGAPILDANRHPSGAILIIRDATRRRQAEDELREFQMSLEKHVADRTTELQKKSEELQESQRALINIVEDLNDKTFELKDANEKLLDLDRLKSMFIASMSHELRTPLNSIIGFSSILLNEWTGSLNEEQKENISSVLRSGKHLLSLINDVIDVSKIEAGKVESLAEDFALEVLVQEAVASISFEAENKNLELQVQVEPCQLYTDRRRLLQCLLNLLSNAIKFTEQGSIKVWAGPSEDGRAIEVVVNDTGIGIREEDLDKLFYPFVRLDSPLRAKVLGTGLGLYLTQKLTTEVLHGRVSVSSVLGQGSRFALHLPMTLSEKEPL
jgi:PAS domain S-box-containing protein